MADWPERDIDKIAKGWEIAMSYSKDRLKRVYDLKGDQLDDAINEGRLVLETVCLFMHACVKHGQYKLPLEFWRILHAEYGIIVYPSAFTEEVEVQGLGTDVTFTEAYYGHIMMFGGCRGPKNPPPCPFEFLKEPPPVYQKDTPQAA
ncbi:hypothetical protein FALBO_331 [Fusarium albosuccineum]|uniref:Uncharacterized protein n=1 Tax=Fusarium albosuccineum TaxID=1237068 RepID=A0A8H4LQI6_9HYPO|nr:hypothetical protein FALBO_331 [Fusarium albosuccineum]KAF5010653.1 hypothetical protein FDECE_3193 [Fusarium decemcellulare]